MAEKFENKKLNKEDHAQVDKEAGAARGIVEGTIGLGALLLLMKTVPWKRIGAFVGKIIFKV